MRKIGLRSVSKAAKKRGRAWRWYFWPFIKRPKEPLPAQDQETYDDKEIEITGVAENDIREISVDWERCNQKKQPQCDRLQAQICGLKDEIPKLNREVAEAKNRDERAAERLNSFLPPSMKPVWMIGFLIFLGIVELPINGLIFSLLAEGKALTFVMALIIFSIPLVAHLFGHTLKQEVKPRYAWLFLIGAPLLVTWCLTGIGLLRGKYLAAVLSRLNIANLGISPALGTWIFIGFNMMIFGIACFISYFGSHPQHQEYHQARVRYRKEHNEYERKREKSEKTALQINELRNTLAEKARERENCWKSYVEKAKQKAALGSSLCATYRAENLFHRPSAIKPKCFDLPFLLAEIPENLASLTGKYFESGKSDVLPLYELKNPEGTEVHHPALQNTIQPPLILSDPDNGDYLASRNSLELGDPDD